MTTLDHDDDEYLTGRDRAILRAVALGGAELGGGRRADLFLDGRCCCDQSAARRPGAHGPIAAATLGLLGQRVAAAFYPAGRGALSTVPCARRLSRGDGAHKHG